jgi:erythromycin esterase-like protein
MPIRSSSLSTGLVLLSALFVTSCQNLTSPTHDDVGTASTQTLDLVAKDVCEKKFVLLGENGFHGDGGAIAFKTELAQKLINTCGFNTVLFEAGFYDFAAMNMKLRKGEEITSEMFSSSVGAIRNKDKEIAPFIPFLFERIQTGDVFVGGLDHQLGARGAFYSLGQMFTDLSAPLPPERRDICAEKLKQRVWYSFSKNDPYSEQKFTELQQCLSDIDAAFQAQDHDTDAQGYRAMAENYSTDIENDFTKTTSPIAHRDKAMFANFNRLVDHAPAQSKFIIWSANTHTAKDASTMKAYGPEKNLGAYIYEAYPDDTFSLGFTAAGGSFRYSQGKVKPVPPAPAHSLEAKVLDGIQGDIGYISGTQLDHMDDIPASVFGHEYQTQNWGQIFDGIVVLREEHPAQRTGN